MQRNFDWKFILTLLATAAGVVATLWIWYADANAKSLSALVISKTALHPDEQRALPGLEISIDGTKLVDPYLTIFEIKNDGGKDISASDFESPLEILAINGASFVRARVSSTTPKDVNAVVTFEGEKLSLQPLLLNRTDQIVIAGITSGAAPTFDLKARIIGIPKISLREQTVSEKNLSSSIAHFTSWILLVIVAAAAAAAATTVNPTAGINKIKVGLNFCVAIFLFGGVISASEFFSSIGYKSTQATIFFAVASWVMISIGAFWVAYKRKFGKTTFKD